MSATVPPPPVPLGPTQRDLLAHYPDTSLERGLSNSDAATGVYRSVTPPLNCPAWVCCLLPCIKSIPSMKLFRQIQPEDAEVLRDGTWVSYDAQCVVPGDVVRLHEGDLVPGDCTVLTLNGGRDELLVNVAHVTGAVQPRTCRADEEHGGAAQPTTLPYGANVLQGSAVVLVTATGDDTVLARLIRRNLWPPGHQQDLSDEAEETKAPFLEMT